MLAHFRTGIFIIFLKGVFILAKWFSNLKIFGKVLVLAVLLLVFLVGIGLQAIRTMYALKYDVEKVYYGSLIPIKLLANIRYNTMLNSNETSDHLKFNDPKEMLELHESIRLRTETINKLIAEFRDTGLTAAELELLTQFEAAIAEYRPLRNQVLDLSQNNFKGDAQALYIITIHLRDNALTIIGELMNLRQKFAEDVFAAGTNYFINTTRNFIAILALAVFIALGFAFYLGRMMSRPLKTLEHAASQVAEGDLRAEWTIRSRDEIGTLSASLHKMVQDLRLVVQQVHDTASNVAASAEELTASTQQSSQAANQITHAAQELASGADRQNDKVQATMATIEQVSAATEQIAATAQEVATSAQHTSQRAKDGNQAMAKAMEEMDRINASTNEVAGTVRELGRRSQAIGQIVDVISSIADQTNLLALNAAIEAARAGDQGRGFAVVAEEVRKLAEQSSQAAKEIASLIHQIQGETGKAVQSMENNSRLVEKSGKVIGEGAKAFQQIEQDVASVAGQVQEVSRSTEELAKGSEEMVTAVKIISDVTQQIAAISQEMASSTEEQSASLEEVATSADALARLGQELQGTIARFKL